MAAELVFDSDTPAVLADWRCAGSLVATYADLITPELLTQYGPRLVVIDRGSGDPHNVATVADIEPGCLSPLAGAALIKTWLGQSRQFVTAYHDRALWSEVDSALTGVQVYRWVTTLDGTVNPDGKYPAVVQILGEAQLGFHADLSIRWNDRWHPLPGPPDLDQQTRLMGLANTVVDAGHQIQAITKGL